MQKNVASGNDFLSTMPQNSDFDKRESTQIGLHRDLEFLYIKESEIRE